MHRSQESFWEGKVKDPEPPLLMLMSKHLEWVEKNEDLAMTEGCAGGVPSVQSQGPDGHSMRASLVHA